MSGKLVLAAKDPEFVPEDLPALVRSLQESGLAGPALDEAEHRFRTGLSFLDLVTFMGCSPTLKLEPDPAGGPFCHLELNGPYDQVEFLGGKALKPPRCLGCRHLVSDWRDELLRWERERGPQPWTCPKCGLTRSLYRLDWRRGAGFARFTIDIHEVFEAEAVPSLRLMDLLRQVTGQRWDYFYA